MGLKELIDALGGDEQVGIKEEIIELRYFDKADHLERSLAHQPNHSKHFHGQSSLPIVPPGPNNSARLNHEWSVSHRPIVSSRKNKGS